jgi:hypothetical protein
MPTLSSGQTYLEAIAIEKRAVQEPHNEYAKDTHEYDIYGSNAVKGHMGGHGHTTPNPEKAFMIGEHFDSPVETSNFNTQEGGSPCDVNGVTAISHSGRKGNTGINIYNETNQYGIDLDTSLNVVAGQVVMSLIQKTPFPCNDQ